MTIEVLFVDGCPSHERLLRVVREFASETAADLVLRRVETPEQAERDRFLGSPTVRVDGRDLDPDAHDRTDYCLACRLYPAPDAWIRAALHAAASARRQPGTG